MVDRLDRFQTMQKVITIYSEIIGEKKAPVSILNEELNNLLADGYKVKQVLSESTTPIVTNLTLLLEK